MTRLLEQTVHQRNRYLYRSSNYNNRQFRARDVVKKRKKAHIIWLSIPLTKIREVFSAKQPKSKTKIGFANAQVERKDSTANMCIYVLDSRLGEEK